MANPPIQIGELTDVPAPGAPIASPWTQEVTNRIVHRFASVAQRTAAWPAPGTGSLSVTLDRLYLEMWDGTAWRRVGGGSWISPVISAPAGGGAGGAIVAGANGRIGRFTIPRATVARFSHSVCLTSTAAYTGHLYLFAVQSTATLWTTFVGAPAAAFLTFHINEITVPGLAAGGLVDVMFSNDAGSVGQVSWFTDNSNNNGRADLDVLVAS